MVRSMNPKPWHFRLTVVFWVVGIAALGCGRGSGEKPAASLELRVAAAASLASVLPKLARAFEAESGCVVSESFAATGVIAAQIRAGAPLDVFLAADEESTQTLAEQGWVVPNSVCPYATGQLVLVFGPGKVPLSMESLKEPGLTRLGVAHPQLAPYGKAAFQALTSLGLLTACEPKLVIGQTVGVVRQYVHTGNVDAALLPAPLALAEGWPMLTLSNTDYAPLVHTLAVPTSAPSKGLAERFAVFVTGTVGQAILTQAGFGPAPKYAL